VDRREEMEGKKESTESEGKTAKYVRWVFVTVISLLIFFTIFMAIYRKYME
jgi:hypothetical protein